MFPAIPLTTTATVANAATTRGRWSRAVPAVTVAASIGVLALAFVAVIQLWPSYEAATRADAPGRVRAQVLGVADFSTSPGTLVLTMVAALGLLGGTVKGLRTASKYATEGRFGTNWVTWYLARPFLGAGIALVLHLALVGGLLEFGSGAEVDTFGVAALAVLAGMFSGDAVHKLSEIFNEVFKTSGEARALEELEALLTTLRRLLDEQLIDEQDYADRKAALLHSL